MSESTFRNLPLIALAVIVIGMVVSFVTLHFIRRKFRVSFALAMVWYFGWLFVLMWIGGLFLFVAGHAHHRGSISSSAQRIVVETVTMPNQRDDSAPSITRSIPGTWRAEKVTHEGTEATIYYMPLPESIDYSKISAPGDPNSSDPLAVLKGAVFYWKSAQPQRVKEYFSAGDQVQHVDSTRLAQILGRATGREGWKMTHLVCVGEMLIVRGTFLDTAKGIREIDLWPFSQIEGKWKLHMFSPEVKSIDWFMKLLYQDAITFSP